jgi:hypothetical protein
VEEEEEPVNIYSGEEDNQDDNDNDRDADESHLATSRGGAGGAPGARGGGGGEREMNGRDAKRVRR